MLPKENPSSLSNLMLSTLPSFFALSPCCANSTDSSQSIKNLRGAASHLKSNIFLHLYYHFASSNSQLISQSAVFQPSCNLRSRRRQASLDSVRLWKGDISNQGWKLHRQWSEDTSGLPFAIVCTDTDATPDIETNIWNEQGCETRWLSKIAQTDSLLLLSHLCCEKQHLPETDHTYTANPAFLSHTHRSAFVPQSKYRTVRTNYSWKWNRLPKKMMPCACQYSRDNFNNATLNLAWP